MSYFQSRMHFDESVKSNADSDLEDGEMKKLLTSSLCAQRASGKPDAMVIQEREVSAQTSHLSQDQRASGRTGCIVFTRRNEERDQISSSVFRGALLAGNKDHLMKQARSDLARKEIHVESLNKCNGELQRRTEEQR